MEKATLFDRNQLVHAVIWPNGKNPGLTLVDTDGVVQSHVAIRMPVKGSELAKMMPPGHFVEPDQCTILSMSGRLMVGAKAPFDTAVVTERAEIGFEERMQRLERKERRREQRQKFLEAENRALSERLEAASQREEQEQVVNPLEEEEATTETEQEAQSDVS